LFFPPGGPFEGLKFEPKLPENQINILCSKISFQIKEIGENVIQQILPMNHLDLAQNKQIDILATKGF